jgi:hypothetical protein
MIVTPFFHGVSGGGEADNQAWWFDRTIRTLAA